LCQRGRRADQCAAAVVDPPDRDHGLHPRVAPHGSATIRMASGHGALRIAPTARCRSPILSGQTDAHAAHQRVHPAGKTGERGAVFPMPESRWDGMSDIVPAAEIGGRPPATAWHRRETIGPAVTTLARVLAGRSVARHVRVTGAACPKGCADEAPEVKRHAERTRTGGRHA
jgi:hypothetical protein